MNVSSRQEIVDEDESEIDKGDNREDREDGDEHASPAVSCREGFWKVARHDEGIRIVDEGALGGSTHEKLPHQREEVIEDRHE